MAAGAEHQIGTWVKKPGPDACVVIRDDLPIPSPSAEEVLIKLDCTFKTSWYRVTMVHND